MFLNAALHALPSYGCSVLFRWKLRSSALWEIFTHENLNILLYVCDMTDLLLFVHTIIRLYTSICIHNDSISFMAWEKSRHLLLICVNDMLMIFLTQWLCSQWNASILHIAHFLLFRKIVYETCERINYATNIYILLAYCTKAHLIQKVAYSFHFV